tara:strand:+ start:388 stop:801 length:414 start_codon:yes stop_codon:yes gene_type:complete
MINEYRVWSTPHKKASSRMTKYDSYELDTMDSEDLDYHTKDQKEILDKVAQDKETVEIEALSEYAYKYARDFNESNDNYMMNVEVLSSKASPLTLVKRTHFKSKYPNGKGLSTYKNFTGLTVSTLKISFKKANRIEF